MSALDSLVFDNSFTRELPGDPDKSNRRRQVLKACYSEVTPTPVATPRLLAYWPEVASLLELPSGATESAEFAEVFAGNRVPAGARPYAACYGGHQFGNWAGQLGDGRAITLGETVNSRGERWELQLKGAGPTPYSRTADGRAVLRSSLREFLVSEAMFHLGVPTTRALSLVTTGDQVVRDMFYDGHPQHEPGAVVCRVAPTFIRFGNFEIMAAREDLDTMRKLADYTIRTHFPQLGPPSPEAYVRWFEDVCRRTIATVVHWMRVGFVHGVMNTDNMSILGLTIDYGPYGYLDDYDPNWTPNTTDAHGRRYRYGQQPNIACWNLSRFASAIVPLVGATEPLQTVLEREANALAEQLPAMFRSKLGLVSASEQATELAAELPDILYACGLDMTIFYRLIAGVPSAERLSSEAAEQSARGILDAASYATPSGEERERLASWLTRYARCAQAEGRSDAERREQMQAVNPRYILRNYMAQLAIDRAEQGDASVLQELMALVRKPYDEQPDQSRWADKRPDWARNRAGCSMLSCSS